VYNFFTSPITTTFRSSLICATKFILINTWSSFYYCKDNHLSVSRRTKTRHELFIWRQSSLLSFQEVHCVLFYQKVVTLLCSPHRSTSVVYGWLLSSPTKLCHYVCWFVLRILNVLLLKLFQVTMPSIPATQLVPLPLHWICVFRLILQPKHKIRLWCTRVSLICIVVRFTD